ncbi:MAG: hypothetical protein M1450_00765 [Patescibacteria group bacterium]|nr:hypothetical protein [Patescibacteria group bacterium]
MTGFKKFLSWKLVFIPLLIIVFVVGGNAVKRFFWSRELDNSLIFHPEQLPECGDKKVFFTVSPIKDGLYRNVVPLGKFGPEGGHVFPTKHTYFMAPAKNIEEQTDVDVLSPGDLYITTIQRWNNKTLGLTEYFLYASPCKDVEVTFYHLNELSPKLASALNKTDYCREEQTGKTQYEFCGKITEGIQVKAGELLGIANPAKKKSIKQFFDFGMSDHRTPELKFANPGRWVGNFDKKHMVCPYDYFTPDLRSKFLSQMADYDDPSLKRTTEPLCGEYMQDIPGTAQGVWFKVGADSREEDAQITLGHHNVLTQKGFFSIGTMSTETIEVGGYPFDPRPLGIVNRDFKDIKANGQIYCFEPTALTGTYNYPFRIILQMTSPTKLKIEGQKTQGCGSGPFQFSSSYTDFER